MDLDPVKRFVKKFPEFVPDMHKLYRLDHRSKLLCVHMETEDDHAPFHNTFDIDLTRLRDPHNAKALRESQQHILNQSQERLSRHPDFVVSDDSIAMTSIFQYSSTMINWTRSIAELTKEGHDLEDDIYKNYTRFQLDYPLQVFMLIDALSDTDPDGQLYYIHIVDKTSQVGNLTNPLYRDKVKKASSSVDSQLDAIFQNYRSKDA